jgi:hypothetical protein
VAVARGCCLLLGVCRVASNGRILETCIDWQSPTHFSPNTVAEGFLVESKEQAAIAIGGGER